MKKYFAFILFGMIVFNGISQEPTSKLEKDGKDPVCGMKVKKGTSLVSVYKEKQHGFCGKSCKEKFDKDPEKYVKK
ncbi:YHS domain-containing protein [Emticicia fontis]